MPNQSSGRKASSNTKSVLTDAVGGLRPAAMGPGQPDLANGLLDVFEHVLVVKLFQELRDVGSRCFLVGLVVGQYSLE